MFRLIRIAILLYILLFVALGTWFNRAVATDWTTTLIVTVYPIAGDSTAASRDYVAALNAGDLQPVAEFFASEAERFGRPARETMRIQRGNTVSELPPPIPFDGNLLERMWWGFKMRYWSYRVTREDSNIDPHIKLFVIYFEPAGTPILERSVGLQKGMFGIVNAFAGRRYRGTNQVVMAHEILHTLGASDKYDPATGLPVWPQGFVNPEDKPEYPQTLAEIMAGRRAISAHEAVMPASLTRARIGDQTALEIRLKSQK